MAGRTISTTPGGHRAYWTLRIIESALMLAMIAGIGLFAYSLIDIVRIETSSAPAGALPPTAWPGVFLFGGALIALQIVRAVLVRYRHEDGTPRGDARDLAAAATAEALAADDADADAEAGAVDETAAADAATQMKSDTGTGA